MRLDSRGQHGQVAVIFALSGAALIGMVGLVLMGGLLFWNQRELQTAADAAALAGANQLTGSSCTGTSAALPTAVDTLAAELSVTAPSTPGWACGVGFTASFTTDISATFTYPWQSHNDEIAVKVTRGNIQLLLGNFVGSNSASVAGWAVAQRNFASLPKSFGLVAAHGMICQGSGSKVDVAGSLYAGPSSTSGAASIVHNGNCAIYTHETTIGSSTDWGDILAYDQTPLGSCTSASNPCWLGSAGSCTPPQSSNGFYGTGTKASFCADGFELQGYATPTCGVSYAATGSSPAGSMYMTTGELSGSPDNPNPCDGVPPLVPQYTTSTFATPDPNTDSNAIATLSNPSAAGAGCSSSQVLGSISVSLGGITYSGFGTGPSTATEDSNKWVHFHPGCYGYIDVQTLVGNGTVLKGAVLDPGFYYFNGSGSATGGGICMDGKTTQVLGQDITLEFVNGASLSTGACMSAPTTGCGSSKQCDYGSATALDAGATAGATTYPAAGYTWLASPCSSATITKCPVSTSSWCPSSDSACWNTLIWTPTTITGEFYVKGPSQASFLLGDVIWQGPSTGTPVDNGAGCEFDANNGGQLVGEFICDTLSVQGGTSGGVAAVGQDSGSLAGNPPEAALVE